MLSFCSVNIVFWFGRESKESESVCVCLGEQWSKEIGEKNKSLGRERGVKCGFIVLVVWFFCGCELEHTSMMMDHG